MPPVGLEPTISAGERPQTYALDRAATGTGKVHNTVIHSLIIKTLKRQFKHVSAVHFVHVLCK